MNRYHLAQLTRAELRQISGGVLVAHAAKLFKPGTFLEVGTSGVSWVYKPELERGYVTDGHKTVSLDDVSLLASDKVMSPLGAVNALGCDMAVPSGAHTYLCRKK